MTRAQSPQDDVAQKLVGAWRLVSAEGTDPTFHQDYRHATGLIIYDRSGWMSAQIDIKGTRKPFANGPDGGTNEEKVANFHDYLSYYGTYTLDLKAQTITHHVHDASAPNGAASITSGGSSSKVTTGYSLSRAGTAKEE